MAGRFEPRPCAMCGGYGKVYICPDSPVEVGVWRSCWLCCGTGEVSAYIYPTKAERERERKEGSR